MTTIPRDEIVRQAAIFLEAQLWEEMGRLLADIIIRVHIENPTLIAQFLTGVDSPDGYPLLVPWLHVRNVMEHHLIEFPGVLE